MVGFLLGEEAKRIRSLDTLQKHCSRYRPSTVQAVQSTFKIFPEDFVGYDAEMKLTG